MMVQDVKIRFENLLRSILDGSVFESFWDWPIMIRAIVVFCGYVIISQWLRRLVNKASVKLEIGQKDHLFWTIFCGIITTLFAWATFDLFVSRTLFQAGENRFYGVWLLALPIMTIESGIEFSISIGKRYGDHGDV